MLLAESNLLRNALSLTGEMNPDQAVKLIATRLVMDIWVTEPAFVQSLTTTVDGVSTKEQCYEMLRQGLSHPDKVFRITVYVNAFKLIERMITK